ncbi:ataxin-2 homolog isoform X2 [Wyeomyia smithii]|uniref:ataxin-2 homolog isoform X2 n=1 Tax=Wyeomyia smithii TaxID=174621 RepID=UPI002467F58E|nr:ataxin-2 homolog isoform X2 [Wyeomyia smithii]
MNNKRSKTRPGPARTQRQRSITADGIYSNSLFMHAATSHVGNIVQVQTASGVIFEGVFRTFSSQFQVVLEMAHRIEVGPDNDSKIIVDSVVDRLIFKPSDIVSIAAKDVDLDYATRDTFKTDTAISRCNGNGRPEERELEPWDESGTLNGDCEFNLELDANANGWDVNDMFHKNETIYGVQSTFDQSLSGYTVQIQKKDSDDFKAQETEAERIANEIENNPVYKDRIDLENGDEESAFAAVSRPSNSSPQPSSASTLSPAQSSNSMNDKNNSNSSVMPSNAKYIVPAKRKPGQAGKLTVRSTPPPITNNGGPPQQQQQQQQQQQPPSPQAPPHKNSYPNMSMASQQQQQQQQQQQLQQAQAQPQQPQPPSNQHSGGMQQPNPHGSQYGMHTNPSPYGHVQHQPHQQQQPQQQQQPVPQQHNQPSVVNSNNNMNKMNGDGRGDMSNSSNMNVNSSSKPLPQRATRQYPNAATVNYNEPPPSLGPQQMPPGQMQSMGKPPMHVTHPHHAVATHIPPPTVVTADQQQQQIQTQVVMQPHHVVLPPPIIGVATGPAPPQQQQQMQQPPPQPQRQVVVRSRDMDVDNLRKFGQDFKLAPPQQQPPMQNVHQQPPPQHNVQQMQQQQQQQQQDHSSPNQPPMESSPPLSQVQKHSVVDHVPHQQQQQQNQSSQTPSSMVHQHQPPQHIMQSQQPQQQQQQPQSQPPPQQQSQQQQQTQQQQHQATSSSPPQTVQSTVHSGLPNQINTSTSSSNGSVAGNNSSSGTGQNSTSVVDSSGGAGATNTDGTAKVAPKKTFTLNPAAKPFTPRSPSTPNPSRPHTPQTPGPVMAQQQQQPQPQPQQSAYPGQQHVAPQPIIMSYVMPSPQTAFQPTQQHPHAGQPTRIRKGSSSPSQSWTSESKVWAKPQIWYKCIDNIPVAASQIQVAAATGQPLLAPAPIQMFPPYPPTIHPQHFQAPPFQSYRIYHETPQPTQLQYLAPTPPSTTPSPGQPHQQYHPGPQPSPAAGGPPTYAPAHQQQPPHYPMMCPIVAAPPQIMPTVYPNMTPGAPQQNHHQQNLHLMHVAQHPSAQ